MHLITGEHLVFFKCLEPTKVQSVLAQGASQPRRPQRRLSKMG